MSNPESLFPIDEMDTAELTISIKGMMFVMSHANTELYTYRRHPEVNHVYHQYYEDNFDKQIAIFDAPELIEQLRELCFSERILSRPSDWDEKSFLAYQRQKLEQDLDEL